MDDARRSGPATALILASADATAAQSHHDRPLPDVSIFSALAGFAQDQPDAIFLTVTGARGEQELTYRQLALTTSWIARWARDRGARPGQVVALTLGNDLPSITAMLGLLRSGAALLILDPRAPAGRSSAQRSAVGAESVFHPAGHDQPVAGSVAVPAPSSGMTAEAGAGAEIPVPSGARPALVFGTSGSTAASKLVVQSHANLVVNAEALRRHHGLTPGQRFLGCLPIHHVNGLHFTVLGTLWAGAHAVLTDGFDPFRYPRLLEECRPTVASVVPSILESLRYMWRSPRVPTEFSHFTTAAAPLATATAIAVHEALGTTVLQGYGLTETTNFATTMPHGLSPESYADLVLRSDIPAVGVALFGNSVTVLRPDGTPATSGEVGEVCMRGHNVMLGYAHNIQATAHAFRGGWFHSEDLGYLRPGADGRAHLVLTGRIKNIAKVGGVGVSLEEMERTLRTHPAIADAACAFITTSLYGDRITALVVERAPVSDTEIYAHLRLVFPSDVLPHRVVRTGTVPRTPTGKILRRELVDRLYADGAGAERPA